MKSNNLILSIILIFISLNVYSQTSTNFPKNAKKGYIFCYNNETKEWTKINAELLKIKKEGKLEAFQYKLKNLKYDVDITNCIDKKTTEAFEAEKERLKNKKKDNRKTRRLKRKKKAFK
jgi:hypothetical protein